MKLLLIPIIFLYFPTQVNGQNIPSHSYRMGTFKLKNFTAKKIVAYTINHVTVYINMEDYKTAVAGWREIFKTDEKHFFDTSAQAAPVYNIQSRYNIVDSIYKLLINQSQNEDTVFLTQHYFDSVNIRCLIDIDKLIESGNCGIADENKKRHYIIIRQKGTWDCGKNCGWGGRRYFLLKHKNFFYEVIDWMT